MLKNIKQNKILSIYQRQISYTNFSYKNHFKDFISYLEQKDKKSLAATGGTIE